MSEKNLTNSNTIVLAWFDVIGRRLY